MQKLERNHVRSRQGEAGKLHNNWTFIFYFFPLQTTQSPSSDFHYIGLKGVHYRGTKVICYVNHLTRAAALFTAFHSFIFL